MAMKKFMKNLMLVAVAAMGFTACSEVIDESVAPEKQTKTISVVSDITRTTLNNDRTQLVWAEGDTFGAFTDAGDINIVSSAYPADFTLEVAADATAIYAYYPYYSGNDEKTATEMSVGIQGTQYQNAAGVLASYMPMVARGTINDDNTVNLAFEPYGCVIAFNIYGGTSETEKVTSIKFTGNNQKTSGFTYTYDLTDENSVFEPRYDYTLLNLNADAQFVPNGTKPEVASEFENAAYMVVAQAEYAAGVEIVVTTTEKTYTLVSEGVIDCTSCYKTININLAKIETAPEATLAEGNYILAVKNGDSGYLAMAGTHNSNSNRKDAIDITASFSAESMTTSEETIIWTLAKRAEGGYFLTYEGNYLYGSSSSNFAKTEATEHFVDITDNGDGTYTITSSKAGGKSLAHNNDALGFAFYKASTAEGDGYLNDFYFVPATFEAIPSIESCSVKIASAECEGTVAITSKYITEDIVAETDAEWLVVEMTDNATLYYVAEANEGEERTAVVTLTANGASATVTFTQAKKVESTGEAVTKTHDFTNIDGFSDWTTSYMEHVVEYDEATVTFTKANRQTGTITDMPVTKGQDVTLVAKNGATIQSAAFTCQQWTTKAQTITLYYSVDGGQTYASTGVTSSNFSIEVAELPVGTNAVKIGFSSSSNQIGIQSAEITYLM